MRETEPSRPLQGSFSPSYIFFYSRLSHLLGACASWRGAVAPWPCQRDPRAAMRSSDAAGVGMGALPCTRASPTAVGFDRWKPPDPTSACLPILLLGLRFLPQGQGSETPPRTPCTLSQAPSHGEGFAFSVCFRALQSPHCPAFPVGLGELAGMGVPVSARGRCHPSFPSCPGTAVWGGGHGPSPPMFMAPATVPMHSSAGTGPRRMGTSPFSPPGWTRGAGGCLWGPAPGWDSW